MAVKLYSYVTAVTFLKQQLTGKNLKLKHGRPKVCGHILNFYTAKKLNSNAYNPIFETKLSNGDNAYGWFIT
jgi:hypothetical protein